AAFRKVTCCRNEVGAETGALFPSRPNHCTSHRVVKELHQLGFVIQINHWWHTSHSLVGYLLPDQDAKFVEGLTEHIRMLASGELIANGVLNVIHDDQYGDYWGGQDWFVASLVVERDVAAGHWHGQLRTAIRQATYRFGELPHRIWIFWAAKVHAVRYRV